MLLLVPTKNSIGLNLLHLASMAFWVMLPVLVPFPTMQRNSLRSRVALQVEILALRHQLLVFQRRKQKPRLSLLRATAKAFGSIAPGRASRAQVGAGPGL